MMFNYFFGSDTRSLGFLEIVNKNPSVIFKLREQLNVKDVKIQVLFSKHESKNE